jgi:hypothetical protein
MSESNKGQDDMTTIILTIIGILLAAAAALMVIFYGGDAFNSGTVGAQANQIQNAGTNVVSAAQMFRAERAVRPTTLAQLQDTSGPAGAFLDELPALPQGAASTPTLTGGIYTITGVNTDVCSRINRNLGVTLGAPAGDPPVAAPVGNPKMSCVGGTFTARI